MNDLLQPNARFRLNQPPVIAETIDAEVMIVNLEDGRYYSVTGAGVALWDTLVRGSPMAALRAHAAMLFDAQEAVVVADLDRFVGALLKEGILATAAEARCQISEGDRSFASPDQTLRDRLGIRCSVTGAQELSSQRRSGGHCFAADRSTIEGDPEPQLGGTTSSCLESQAVTRDDLGTDPGEGRIAWLGGFRGEAFFGGPHQFSGAGGEPAPKIGTLQQAPHLSGVRGIRHART
jgi:hypothetical protein